ncbi:MAG: methionyl-tRNA formyltransferase [Alphaproteobacteria bacterium]|nr:methionyl-tRNA formyltransferase [Alphaproteobacteria bacterium]
MTPPPLRIAFMGTPDFAVTALTALHQAQYDIAAVYCQPPKPVGRGHQVQKTPAHCAAEALGIEVRTPKTLRDPLEQEKFAALNLDVAVVAAYGLILPRAILSAPKYGCLNIHGSLLPRWRGAAPIQRAILAGDAESGITIMQMDAGLDTGAMLLKESVPITDQTTAQSLHDALAEVGAHLIVRALDDLTAGRLHPTPQPETGATYATKLTREDGKIDWNKPAVEIERKLRALHPWPGCFFLLNGETVKLLAAEIVEGQTGEPGTLLDDTFTIACGNGALRLLSVQRAGGKATAGDAMLRGLRLKVGTRLPSYPNSSL